MAPIHQQYLTVLTFLLQWAYLFGGPDGGDDTFSSPANGGSKEIYSQPGQAVFTIKLTG